MRRRLVVLSVIFVGLVAVGVPARADRAVVDSIPVTNLGSFALDRGRGWLYAADYNRLLFIDAATKETFGSMELDAEIEFVVFEPRSDLVYVGTSGRGYSPPPGTIHVIDPENRVRLTKIQAEKVPNAAVVSSELRRVYVANFRSQTISIIDSRSQAVVATSDVLKHFDDYPVELAINEDDGLLYVSTESGVVYAIDAVTGGLVERQVLTDWLAWPDIAFDPLRKRVYVTGDEHELVYVLSAQLERVTEIDLAESWPATLAVDAEKRLLYVGSEPAEGEEDLGTPSMDVIDIDRYEILERVPAGYPGEIELYPARLRVYMAGGEGILVLSEDAVSPETTLWPEFRYLYQDGEALEGEVTDNVSGVRAVVVTYRSILGAERIRADLSCRDRARRFCFWNAETPSLPGIYDVEAAGVDRAGTRENPGDMMTMTRVPREP